MIELRHRLTELKELLGAGLISDADYEREKQRLLAGDALGGSTGIGSKATISTIGFARAGSPRTTL
ncbi:MAG: SHOCT domain-containing protein [Proteobacteria bacterium]|nr:SHOCT domain-containing protein [Pseudomonadota bacterium]MCP4919636.1 SHOCT domain-containing protein [Pseudomonadota bacterium]